MNEQIQQEILVPNRSLDLQTAENVRDLGGYTTESGAVTQWGRFVRSGDLCRLNEMDQGMLSGHGVKTVIDLRMEKERQALPNVFEGRSNSDKAGAAPSYRVHDFWGTRFDDYRSPDRRAEPAIKLANLYCAGLEKSGSVIAAIFSTFAEPETDSRGPAFLFHCRSGKDRTGVVAALLLSIAGAPAATICADYALTSSFLKTPAVNPVEARKPGRWQLGCEIETMQLTLKYLNNQFGGAESYLTGVGVSPQQLERVRALLLEP